VKLRVSVCRRRSCRGVAGDQWSSIAALCNGVRVAATPVRPRTRRRLAIAVALVFALGATIGVLLARGGEEPPLAPARGPTGDPLAWRPGQDPRFEERAAAGESHVLYEKSPGGATATARRVERWRPLIEAAAARHGVAPENLEALVFLESAGRPEVCAGDVEGACGLTQILAGTATDLLDMRVDLAESERLTRLIVRAERRGRADKMRRLLAQRREVDERFVPRAAIEGAGRYLAFARERLRRDDLALESYHMGVGNLENALAAFGEGRVSYARLYFDSTPLRHARAYSRLSTLGDDSATYLWRLYGAREIMRLYRSDPASLARLEQLHGRKATAEEVLHPRSETEVFATPVDLGQARETDEILPLPSNAAELSLRVDRGMGALARGLGQPRSLYRGLRPEALTMLVYIAAGVREIAGPGKLIVTSTVRDETYQARLVRRNIQATPAYSLHTTGYAFDIERRYPSRKHAVAFQFMLDRLQALNMITYAVEPQAIHVTVSGDARVLEELLGRVE
jgi:hypothetical protein